MTAFLVGAHLDNLNEPSPESYARLRAMRAEVVGMLWTPGTQHRRSVYETLERELGRPDYVIRVGPSGKTTPTSWAVEAGRALAEVPSLAFAEGRVRVRCLNEVNLPSEGGWAPEDYATFLSDCGPLLPDGVELVASPISLGLPDWREWWRRFVAACGGQIPADRIAVNVYAHLLPEACNLFGGFGRPVDVTECNTLGIPPGAIRGAWFKAACRAFAVAGFSSAQVFIAGGKSNGAWDERYVVDDEEAAEIGNRETIHITNREPTVIRGIDISNNNGHVDLKRVRDEWHGQFAVVKVSEDDWGDDDFFDSYAAENLAKARELEMGVGIYTFVRPSKSSPAESVTVIQRALEKLGGLRAGEFVALDVEDENFTGDLHVWLAEALALGSQVFDHLVWKYSADWYTSTRNLEHPDLEPNPTWWASYQSAKPEPQVGWGPIRLWQYDVTEAGAVPGVAGRCDVNVFYGSLDELRALGKKGVAEPVPKPNRVADALAKLRADLDELEQAIKEAA